MLAALRREMLVLLIAVAAALLTAGVLDLFQAKEGVRLLLTFTIPPLICFLRAGMVSQLPAAVGFARRVIHQIVTAIGLVVLLVFDAVANVVAAEPVLLLQWPQLTAALASIALLYTSVMLAADALARDVLEPEVAAGGHWQSARSFD